MSTRSAKIADMARRGLRAARRPLTALAAPVSLPSGPAGAGRGGWSTGDGGSTSGWVPRRGGVGAGIVIAGSGPVERVSDGETVGGASGAGGAGGAGGAASGEAIEGVAKDGAGMAAGGVANGTWPESGMPRLTGAPIPPVVPVVPASASGAGATVGGWNWGVGGATGWASCCCPGAVGWSGGGCWSGGVCWYPAAGAG